MKILKAKYKSQGGVHPSYHKELARDSEIREMPMSQLLRVSMSQHLGAPAKPVVNKKDTILKGQLIGEAAGFISANVHAPTSGTVKNVTEAITAPGQYAPAIEIEPDGEDTWADRINVPKPWNEMEAGELVDIVASAGIAGMGGAGFPTHVKLSPPREKPIDTLIINGAECEPYLTSDFRMMVEHAGEIWEGIQIIRRILGTTTVRIAIESNKPEAIQAMEHAAGSSQEDLAIVELPTEYPQGAEKQQIYSITGREVPSGGLPMDVGTLVENVGTVYAIREAVINGRPLIDRVTTVTGEAVKHPSNVLARLGSSYKDLIEFCGGENGNASKVVSGGPMMGFAQAGLEATTSKTTSGILLLPPSKVSQFTSMPCISCGRCVAACPMTLMPSELSHMLEAEDYEAAQAYNVMDCIECGCCAFVCPAHRPMVQHMRRGKASVAAKLRAEREKKKQG